MPKFYTRFDLPPAELRNDCNEFGTSLTQQHFKKDADINNIIAKYHTTGLLTDPASPSTAREPLFGDFSDMPTDYMSAYDRMQAAREEFMQLPSKVRAEFGDNPAALLDALNNPEMKDKLIDLGIINKPVNNVVDNPVNTEVPPVNTEVSDK
nr:virion structural protein [Microvirus sp.]